MLEERLTVLKDLQSETLADFYKQAFKHKPLMAMFLFDKDDVQINDYGHTKYDLKAAEPRIVTLFDQTATSIENNNLTQLTKPFKTVSQKSQNKAIRARAIKCLEKLV